MLASPWALHTLLATMALGSQSAQDGRAPVPDPASLRSAEKLVRDIFKEDYAKKTPGDKIELARKLIAQSQQDGNEAENRFVLLREAQDLATQAGDADLAFKAIDTLASLFQVNAIPLKHGALQTIAKPARMPEDAKYVAVRLLSLIDEALAADEYDVARKAADAAIQLSKKAKVTALVSRSEAKDKEVAAQRAAFDKIVKAKEALSRNPDDPQANQVVGHHVCIMKGRWESGLPLLAKGDDPKTKALATLELSASVNAQEWVTLGDGWWDLAERTGEPGRQNLRRRATLWYEKAIDSVSGLTKAKVSNRLAELRQDKLGAKSLWVSLNDPKQFGLTGPVGEPIELTAKPGKAETVMLKSAPAGDFDGMSLRVSFKPGLKAHAGITLEDKDKIAYVDIEGKAFMFAHMSGTRWEVDLDKPSGDGTEYVITVLIEQGNYVVYLDGEVMGRIKTPLTRIVDPGLQVSYGPAIFDQIRLRRKR